MHLGPDPEPHHSAVRPVRSLAGTPMVILATAALIRISVAQTGRLMTVLSNWDHLHSTGRASPLRERVVDLA